MIWEFRNYKFHCQSIDIYTKGHLSVSNMSSGTQVNNLRLSHKRMPCTSRGQCVKSESLNFSKCVSRGLTSPAQTRCPVIHLSVIVLIFNPYIVPFGHPDNFTCDLLTCSSCWGPPRVETTRNKKLWASHHDVMKRCGITDHLWFISQKTRNAELWHFICY